MCRGCSENDIRFFYSPKLTFTININVFDDPCQKNKLRIKKYRCVHKYVKIQLLTHSIISINIYLVLFNYYIIYAVFKKNITFIYWITTIVGDNLRI